MSTTNEPVDHHLDQPTEPSFDQPGDAPPPDTDGPPVSKAFRILSWIVVLVITAFAIFGLAEIVLMWLPDDALVSLFGDGDPNPLELEWRAQFFYAGIGAWTLVPPFYAQLRKPQRRVAAMLQGWSAWLALVIGCVLCGSLEVLDVVILAVVTLLAVLHPARGEMLRRPSIDRLQAGVLAVGVVPWMVRAFVGIGDARDANGLPEVGESPAHFVASNVPVAVFAMLFAALIGATDHSSWKLPAWTAGLASVLLGVHALVFDDQAAAIAAPWAVAAIAWGVAYLVATVSRTQRAPSAA